MTEQPATALPKTFERAIATSPGSAREHADQRAALGAASRRCASTAKKSPSPKAYIGYGNPLLDGWDRQGVHSPGQVPEY